jgi:hypothetical protein
VIYSNICDYYIYISVINNKYFLREDCLKASSFSGKKDHEFVSTVPISSLTTLSWRESCLNPRNLVLLPYTAIPIHKPILNIGDNPIIYICDISFYVSAVFSLCTHRKQSAIFASRDLHFLGSRLFGNWNQSPSAHITINIISYGQSSWLQIQRSEFDSRRYQIFWEVVGLERGPLNLVSTTGELLEREK